MSSTQPETVYIDAELFVVTNEDGNVTADADRETAIQRMENDYGGGQFRVFQLPIKVPRPQNHLAIVDLPHEDGGKLPHLRVPV